MADLFEKDVPVLDGQFALVALEQSIDTASGLTYAVPQKLADLAVGERVFVPLGRGNKLTAGYVIERTTSTDVPSGKLKPIGKRDPNSVSLTPDLIELARWMASYYCSPLGMVFNTMLPAAVKRGTGAMTKVLVAINDSPPAVDPDDKKKSKLTKLQQAVLDAAQVATEAGEPWLEMRDLADRAGARSVSAVKQLIEKQRLVTRRHDTITAHWGTQVLSSPTPRPDVLMASQERAVERVADSIGAGFHVHLLHGVTGSGKTEVYLRIIEHVLQNGEDHSGAGVIVLVPEIALTPQTVGRFVGRFDDVAVLHSGLTAAQRHDQWRRIREGKARIVVGARSAIFAPLAFASKAGERRGVIIVDEEHEPSYKQDQVPRYQARDVAIKRAQLLELPVVLGSATPSLESYHNAVRRKSYHLIELPERVAGIKLPTVDIVDLREERRKRREFSGPGGVHLLSVRLETALQQTLDEGSQAMLLLNRRGYANYIACPDQGCGWMMICDYCDATMVYHKDKSLPLGGVVRCHHCGAEQILPQHCPTCSKKVTVFGLGTQRIEEEIARKFPRARMERMDSDIMRTSSDYHDVLERFRNRDVDVLVGTQMIAKGLDFPNVRLVGVVSADTALHMPDFRAAERTFQLVAQVAGRSGRSANVKPGLVIVQTFSPDDQAIQSAAKHDYRGFAERELELREEVGLPPATRMARIVLRHIDLAQCMATATTTADALQMIIDETSLRVRLRGPMPCPIARVAEHHRQQIELIAPDAATLQQLLTTARNAKLLHADATMAVDVDPVSLL